MGAHHAPARSARLAGTGALTATAALALTGAGSGVALAHDVDESSGTLSGNDVSLLCGILGVGECSTESDDVDSSRDSDAGSHDDIRSLFGHDTVGSSADDTDASTGSGAAERSSAGSDSGTRDRSDVRPSSDATQQDTGERTRPASAPSRNALDTPPPPGQIRTIQVPG